MNWAVWDNNMDGHTDCRAAYSLSIPQGINEEAKTAHCGLRLYLSCKNSNFRIGDGGVRTSHVIDHNKSAAMGAYVRYPRRRIKPPFTRVGTGLSDGLGGRNEAPKMKWSG